MLVGLSWSEVVPTTATCEPSAETASPSPVALVAAPRVRVNITLPALSYLIRATSAEPLTVSLPTVPATWAST